MGQRARAEAAAHQGSLHAGGGAESFLGLGSAGTVLPGAEGARFRGAKALATATQLALGGGGTQGQVRPSCGLS